MLDLRVLPGKQGRYSKIDETDFLKIMRDENVIGADILMDDQPVMNKVDGFNQGYGKAENLFDFKWRFSFRQVLPK
ncbi:MAG TPA: hypothetical protein VE954_34505 [Oligoflexus sp.]|nr:hypothetical protein [Oligoflexus sp.]HYX38242.1 hypothetical protein [Oligoflexus sp.]